MNPSPDDPKKTNEDSGFLSRWARRKQQGEAPQPTAQQELEQGSDIGTNPLESAIGELQSLPTDESTPLAVAGGEGTGGAVAEQPVEDKAAEVVLTDADMPALETLDASSDFSPFMSRGVSDTLRKLALKKLFYSGVFNVRDGLDDYDDDFTVFEPLGDTVTSDMKFHQRRRERERLELEEEEARRMAEEELEAQTEKADQEDDVAEQQSLQQEKDQKDQPAGVDAENGVETPDTDENNDRDRDEVSPDTDTPLLLVQAESVDTDSQVAVPAQRSQKTDGADSAVDHKKSPDQNL